MQIVNTCGTAASLDRNSQKSAGGVTLSVVASKGADGGSGAHMVPDEGWVAVQKMANSTVDGSFKLVPPAHAHARPPSTPSLTTSSMVVAPFNAAMEKLSLIVTAVSTDSATPITVEVGTFSGRILPGGASANGKNETWGAWVNPTEGAPKAGLRAGKPISVAIATRIIMPPAAADAADAADAATAVDGTHFTISKGATVSIVTAILSNIDTNGVDPLPTTIAAVRALSAADLPAIRAGHSGWWNTFWSRSSLSLPTRPTIERFWYGSQYTSGASARSGGAGGYGAAKTAPALQSAWLVGGAEHNGYTLDYNAEAQFYGVASSNHPELVLPFATTVLDFVSNARTESAYFKCPGGLHFPGAIGPFGYYNMGWMHMHSHGSFASLPLIWHWQYTRNNSFLTDGTIATSDTTATPYALIVGLAKWWLCHLTKESSTAPAARGDGYIYSDLDDCAYEDSDYYNRPSRHPPSTNFCNATAYSDGGNRMVSEHSMPYNTPLATRVCSRSTVMDRAAVNPR